MVTGGDPPNAFVTSDPHIFRDLAGLGLERDLTDFYKEIGATDGFFPIVRELSTVDGKMVKVPLFLHIDGMVYWNMDVAKYFAEVEGIEMTDQHWEVVNFLRDYYKQYQIAPMIKILVKEIGKKLGPDKGNTKYLYELYPGGPAKQACKIAGLPKPTGCV